MPKFIHADLIAQYAQDANECEQPWLRWQFSVQDAWHDASKPLSFSPDLKYRRKPKTVSINGIEVPEPVREPLEKGQEYWKADTLASLLNASTWNNDSFDNQWLAAGLIHLTKEAAQIHIDAMLSFTRTKEN